MTDHRLQDRNGQVVRIEATPEPIAIDTARTAVLVVDTQNDFGAQGGMFDRAGIDISMIQGAIGPTAGKKPTLTLDPVPYTANAHPMRGRDGASHRDNGRLDVQVSSAGTPGSGTTPEGHHAGPATLVRPRRRMMISAVASSPIWRTVLVTVAAAGAFSLVLLAAPNDAQMVPSAEAQASVSGLGAAAEDTAIRPFHSNIPDEALVDLRRRLAATRWPDRETVNDRSQGVQLAKIQELVRYWGTDYDWRKAEAQLNAWPQFMTTIDGVDIHFIHVRSRHPNTLALIMTHGWPGSVFELLKTVGPLTDPPAYGGRAEDAFDLVLPSMPGYSFSGKPTGTGWNPDRIARAWAELMRRLGYSRYVAQGGDWGAPISSAMARQAPAGLLGIHVNLPATVPPEVAAALAGGGPAPAGLSEQERAAFDVLDTFYKKYRAYAAMMGTRPQVIGQALTDSPAGLAAWMYDYNNGEPERLLTKDDFLDDVTLYWLTNSATSAARLYWETSGQSVLLAAAQKTAEISLPVAITVFPDEVYRAPETWARRAYRNLIYFHEVDKGGHFAAWEEPQLFSEEIRAAFRSLRP
jgi:pimeloyl-ACP methyl ester carboxylesterase